jgi:hypothetical protein
MAEGMHGPCAKYAVYRFVSVSELYTRPAYIIPEYRDLSALRQVKLGTYKGMSNKCIEWFVFSNNPEH